MRTTLVIDDALLRHAKLQAARAGTTLSALVERALRETLRQRPVDLEPFGMPTYGRRSNKARHEPSDFARALLDDDTASLNR